MLCVRVMAIAEAAALPEPLSEGTLDYAARPGNEAVRTQRRAGLCLAAALYREVAGRPLPALILGERGKPTPTEGDLAFNITHAGSLVAAAVGEGELGIDMEAYTDTDADRAERLTRLFSEREQALVAAAPDKVRCAVEIFVRKEALSKRDGRGLAVLRQMDSTAAPPRYEDRPLDACGREYYLCVY